MKAPLVQAIRKGTRPDGHDTRHESTSPQHREMDVRTIQY